MRNRGNKLHLQLGQLDRAEHFAPLDSPDGSAGQRQGNTENTDEPEDGAPRGGSDVDKLLRSLFVVEPLDFLQVLTDTFEGWRTPLKIQGDRFVGDAFKNRSQHFIAHTKIFGPIALEAFAHLNFGRHSSLKQIFADPFVYAMIRFARLVGVFQLEIAIAGG